MRAEDPLHLPPIGLRQRLRHKCLHRSRKTAAMHPHGPLPLQNALRQGKRQRQAPLLRVRWADVLQLHEGGATRSPHQRAKPLRIAGAQRRRLLRHAPVLLKEMDGPQQGAIAYGSPQHAEPGEKRLLGNLREHLFGKAGSHLPHLLRDGGILVRQARMTAASVLYHHRKPEAGKITFDAFHGGSLLVLKVQRHKAPTGAGQLIQQSAGLSKIFIFRILANLRQLYRRKPPARIQLIDRTSDKDNKGSGTGKARAARHLGVNHSVEAPGLHAIFAHTRQYAPYQRDRSALLRGAL